VESAVVREAGERVGPDESAQPGVLAMDQQQRGAEQQRRGQYPCVLGDPYSSAPTGEINTLVIGEG
jgi:hypothetical protein